MIKRSPAQWQALFSQQHRSGLSAAAFCRQHKLCPKYFSLRKKQLHWQPADHDNNAKPPATWLPVRSSGPSTASIQIRWQSVQLSLPANVPSRWLAELIKGLGG